MTPGDAREKIIAGTSTALGGAVGGLGCLLLYPGCETNVCFPVEMIGGYAGDVAGQGVGDALCVPHQ